MNDQPMIDDIIQPPPAVPEAAPPAAPEAAQPAVSVAAPPDPEVRRRLIRQFEQWLDRMAAGEPPPPGLPVEIVDEAQQSLIPQGAVADQDPRAGDASADLLSLAGAMTALNGEVRLQGRAFRQLADVLSPLTAVSSRIERIESAQELIAREIAERFADLTEAHPVQERSAPEPSDSSMPQSSQLLEVLFDLHERLTRGLRNFIAAESSMSDTSDRRPGFLARIFGARRSATATSGVDALGEGYRLALSRLEAAFHQWGIERIGDAGEMFDPALMAVVDVCETDDEPDGTVVDVYRSGYCLHDRVLATARVKVAKSPLKANTNMLENDNG